MKQTKSFTFYKRDLDERLEKLFGAIRLRANSKLAYNFNKNIPAGIVKTEGEAVMNALHSGIVSGLASDYCRFSTNKAIDLAFDLLEDHNCHTEGAALMEAAKKMGYVGRGR